jgi:hypothetical protein
MRNPQELQNLSVGLQAAPHCGHVIIESPFRAHPARRASIYQRGNDGTTERRYSRRMRLPVRQGFAIAVAGFAVGLARMVVACSDSATQPGPDATTPPGPDTGLACPTGFVECNGTCVDLSRDPVNCGACSKTCSTANAEVCSMGQCALTCGGGATKCGASCADLRADPSNCGACGTKCDPGKVCADGGCALSCLPSLTACDVNNVKLCVDLQKSHDHCGKCDTPCDPSFRCDMGACTISCQQGQAVCQVDGGDSCTDLRFDPKNCGKCSNSCEAGTFCSLPADGGADAQASCGLGCFGGTTLCGGRCSDTKIDRYNCGGCFKVCDGGAACVNSVCQ